MVGVAFKWKYHSSIEIDLEEGLIFTFSVDSEDIEKEEGSIIHTSHTNFAFPSINVRVGDKGIISKVSKNI